MIDEKKKLQLQAATSSTAKKKIQLPEPNSDTGLVSESENKIQRRNEDFKKLNLLKTV